MQPRPLRALAASALLTWTAVALAPTALAADWPTHRGDNARSGSTDEPLDAARLRPAWTWEAAAPAMPAWPGPARWDAYASVSDLGSMRAYDDALHPVIVGDAVYVATTSEDAVYRLDRATGETRWTYSTGGPVRVAPTVADGRVYFGSDDGRAYCVDAETGSLVWRTEPAAEHRWVVNNGRLISTMPVRTGVLVRDGLAYFAASLMPWHPSYLYAVDAATGLPQGDGAFTARMEGQRVTFEAALLASDTKLVAPQGRIPPVLIDRATGATLGQLAGGGGSFVLLTGDDHVIHGPGNKDGWLTDSAADTRERIATFPQGNAVVVVGDTAYLLADRSLSAVSRTQQTVHWTVDTLAGLEVIRAGGTLICGGTDVVEAYNRADGRLLWRHRIDGRAKGLALANGTLIVGTDAGRLHAFTPDAAEPFEGADADASAGGSVSNAPDLDPVAPPAAWSHRGLHSRFVFQGPDDPRTPAFDSLAGDTTATVQGTARLQRFDAVHGLRLADDAQGLRVTDDFTAADLPTEAITLIAWARIDEPRTWGGLFSALQDNGSFERGLLLGYRDDKPCFGVMTEAGGSLTYLTAEQAFTPGRWHHIAGVYDGRVMRLYLDGDLVAGSDAQSGPIVYPPTGVVQLGAYRDDNEDFPMRGALHEVTVVGAALSPREVAAHRDRMADRLPAGVAAEVAQAVTATGGAGALTEPATAHTLPREPRVRFTAPGAAVIEYETDRPVATAVRLTDANGDRSTDGRPARSTTHRVEFTGLSPSRVYHFEIDVTGSGGWTKRYECDTHFDFTTHAPRALDAEAIAPDTGALADELIAARGRGGAPGTAVLWRGDPALAAALVARGWSAVLLEPDASLVERRRAELQALGVLGRWSQVLHTPDLGDAALPVCFGDVVYGDREGMPLRARAWAKPNGGVLALDTDGELSIQPRGPLPGAGVWSSMYGLPDNTAFGGETLGGTTKRDGMDVQWFGEPGPRYQSDRQNRKPAPLAANGRLYIQGLHQVIAVDAFDGTVLWNWDLPGFVRFNVPRDCGNWACDDDRVYLAIQDEAWVLDGNTGDIVERWPVPAARRTPGRRDWQWGYIVRSRGRLIGSSVQAGSTFTDWWGGTHWYDGRDGAGAAKVCSDLLFSLEAQSGRRAWAYERGLILNTTIAVADGKVLFIECTDPELKAGGSRRLGDELFGDALRLVALDEDSGATLFDVPISLTPATTSLSVAVSDGRYVAAGSGAGSFSVDTFSTQDGELLWRVDLPWETNHHGKHLSRPAIQGGRVILRPHVLSLEDGEPLPLSFPGGHQCGTYALAENAVLLRAGDMSLWDLTDNSRTQWDRVRPDCWLSTIAANGMVLSPEGGGGCSCGSWMESSMAFLPRVHRATP